MAVVISRSFSHLSVAPHFHVVHGIHADYDAGVFSCVQRQCIPWYSASVQASGSLPLEFNEELN